METIAIIGMSCRFPGANDPESFWELLRQGVCAVNQVSPSRWDANAFYSPYPATPGKMNTQWGGFLKGIEKFDPDFFNISAREAEYIDPQQRLVLEVAWEALENAGIIPEKLAGSQTGVFIGIGSYDYHKYLCQDIATLSAYSAVGTSNSIAANRLSYLLDLRGPSVAIDTACSSSLVAVHFACQSLQQQETDLCLVGGVNLILTPEVTISFSQAQMMSADGRCKTFDREANGYVRGEGCGVVVLKRFADACRDGDKILGVIRGSAVNQDGLSNGITAPNGPAQQIVIRKALANSGVQPAEINYIEAHGTGTSLGDPIEIGALFAVFKPRAQDQPLVVGSVKTNIGHLEAAAGIASLIKVILALQHEEIPPNLHFHQPNPYINWEELPAVIIPTLPIAWSRGAKSRLAGLSSFGFGGTNSHLVMEEAPLEIHTEIAKERPLHLLTLSAKNENALQELTQKYLDFISKNFISKNLAVSLADICFTANTTRTSFNNRLSVVAASSLQLHERLSAFVTEENVVGLFTGKVKSRKRPKITFLFTGQGSQYIGMGKQLYEQASLFRHELDRCDAILKAEIGISIINVLYPQVGETSLIDQTAYTQPVLFAIEYALYQLWQSWGIQPDVVMGHSVGEYVAATVAGIFSLEDGLKLIAHRGRLMQQLPSDGEMVAVIASVEQVNQLIAPYAGKIAIAAINGPVSVVISGESAAMKKLRDTLEAEAIKTKQLQVSHAFHSPLMEPMLVEFAAVANQIIYNQPQIPIVSNVTGNRADESIARASYWVNHVRQPVKFAQSMETLHQAGYEIFLEIGAKPILLGMGRQCLPEGVGIWLPSLREGQSDWQQMLQSLAELYVRGVQVDWLGFDRDYPRKKVALPTYPFQRQRYWVDASPRDAHQLNQQMYPLLGSKLELAPTGQTIYQQYINLTSCPWIGDHQVYDTAVIPGVSYVAMAFAAVGTPSAVEDINFIQPLFLPTPNTTREIQFLIHPTGSNATKQNVEVFSRDAIELDTWQKHAEITLLKTPPSLPILQVDIQSLHQQLTPVENNILNNIYTKLSLVYGLMMQAVYQAWVGEGISLLEVAVPETLEPWMAGEPIHPVLLDACVRLYPGALDSPVHEPGVFWAPWNVRGMTLSRPAPRHFYAYVNQPCQVDTESQTRTYDIHLLDEIGQSFGYIDGFTVRRAPKAAFWQNSQVDIGNWLYKIDWPAADVNQLAETIPGNWLILTDPEGVGQQLALELQEKGGNCILVSANVSYEQIDQQHFQIDPNQLEHFQKLLYKIDRQQPLNIIYLWSMVSNITETNFLPTTELQNCGSILHLVQAISRHNWQTPPSLWLVTKGTQAINIESEPIQLNGSSLWGLGRVIALEYPEMKCICLDLPLRNTAEGYLKALLLELSIPQTEDQIVIRQDKRYVARLTRDQRISAQGKQSAIDLQHPMQLRLSEYGVLDNLCLVKMSRCSPQMDEVEIQVQASTVNFRDVLNALGMLKEYYAEKFGISQAKDLTFGFECAGTIVSVGENVSHLQVGDEVVALVTHYAALSSFVTLPAIAVVKKPIKLSFQEATTIPLAFLTAHYGLHELAKIQPGERVLIHAAAGGVGQAAVQIALSAGAEVFATASLSKWEFLKSMGVKHISNSRSLEFADEIMNLTRGQGVDIVLNSLNGDFIHKSLQVMADKGRFIEIGKIGIWDESQVKALRSDVTYLPFDLGEVNQTHPGLISSMLQQLMEKFSTSTLKPLPQTVFPLEQVVDAFRYMAAAKHIGKVVISLPQITRKAAQEQFYIQQNASYLITGGLGALGLEVAQWLVEKGARNLVLTGRSQVSVDKKQRISHLEASGAKVLILPADVAQVEQLAEVIAKIDSQLPPLRGVIHTAGVLDDGLLTQQSLERFAKVMAPKVQGAWNLHTLTRERSLDFFVCFSSISSLIGSVGQGNYAAANAFMDSLAHYRRSIGLPGLSINWGPVSQLGMAATLDTRNQSRFKSMGVNAIAPAQLLVALELLLHQSSAQVAVASFNWQSLLENSSLLPPFLANFSVSLAKKVEQSEFLTQLATATASDRYQLLINHLSSAVAQVLGQKLSSSLDLQQSFSELGMDSLTALELRNLLQRSLNCSLPFDLIFTYPTITDLVNYLAEEVLAIEVPSMEKQSNNSSDLSTTLDELSESEIEKLLAQELFIVSENKI